MLEVLKGHKTIVGVAREHDLKQGEIQQWIDTFITFGTQALKVNLKSMEAIYQEELKRTGKRSVSWCCRLRVKTELEAQGHKVSVRRVAGWLGVPWSTVHYKPRKRKPVAVDR